MARVFYAMEKYRATTRVLASRPGRIKERLEIAALDIMDCHECEPVMQDWCNEGRDPATLDQFERQARR